MSFLTCISCWAELSIPRAPTSSKTDSLTTYRGQIETGLKDVLSRD